MLSLAGSGCPSCAIPKAGRMEPNATTAMGPPARAESARATQPTESLTGTVERLTYHSPESGYTVARLQVPKQREPTTIVGNFGDIQPGQSLELQGYWHEHSKYGRQFQVTQARETQPATLTGLEKYLGSGLIKGVGPKTAKRIVQHFGLDTLEVIEHQSERLNEVRGLGPKRVAQIQQAWEEQKAIREVMVFLQGHGVSTTYAAKIFKTYGQNAIAQVQDNPYRLATDIRGIGFRTADRIAQNVGVSPWSQHRYRAGLLHQLEQAAEDGHCFLPQPELRQQALELLSGDEHQAESEAVDATIAQMGEIQELAIERGEGDMPLCYQPAFYHTEVGLARRLRERLARPPSLSNQQLQASLGTVCQQQGASLSQQQRQAVETAATARVTVLTGGPGSGKTFTTRTIVRLWHQLGYRVALAAPTGRAAQRLSEVVGQPAQTLHRLLAFEPRTMGFKHNADNPLPQQAVVVDEASMLDLFLAHALLKAVSPQAQLLVVGDADQLPSVGPGMVLRDLIDSGQVPVACLSEVFRQAAQSAIVQVAHQIDRGRVPQIETISRHPQSNCLQYDPGEEPERNVWLIGQVFERFLPQQGFDPTRDAQLLCPMTRGALGTRNFNRVLQEQLNPAAPEKAELARGGQVLRVGDRVIQQQNDYQRGAFNGDLGTIEAIDTTEQEVTVDFGNQTVSYDYADLDELDLAWAITVHKSQGSEYPVVVLPLHKQHYPMLSRHLFYTAVTRAQQLCVVIGSYRAIAMATKRVAERQRYTRLQQRLQPQAQPAKAASAGG